ncbi:hypothetical protein CYMTET_22529, partial [Cymbomonas tetramitiformis]
MLELIDVARGAQEALLEARILTMKAAELKAAAQILVERNKEEEALQLLRSRSELLAEAELLQENVKAKHQLASKLEEVIYSLEQAERAASRKQRQTFNTPPQQSPPSTLVPPLRPYPTSLSEADLEDRFLALEVKSLEKMMGLSLDTDSSDSAAPLRDGSAAVPAPTSDVAKAPPSPPTPPVAVAGTPQEAWWNEEAYSRADCKTEAQTELRSIGLSKLTEQLRSIENTRMR